MTEHYFQDIQGWFDDGFAQVYREAVARVPNGGALVELGCWKGKSLAFLLVEAANSGKKLNIFGVDHFRGSVGELPLLHEAAAIDLAAVCADNVKRSGYPCKLIVEGSPAAAAKFEDASVDFVLIDASHDGESVAADIKAWLPKVKPGGVLAGHDYGYSAVGQAVRQAFGAQARERDSCWWVEIPKGATNGDHKDPERSAAGAVPKRGAAARGGSGTPAKVA